MTIEDYQAMYNAYLADYNQIITKAQDMIDTFSTSNISGYFTNLIASLKEVVETEDTIKEGLRQQVIIQAEADFATEINDSIRIKD